MGVAQPQRNLSSDAHGVVDRERTQSQAGGEGAALDQLEHQVRVASIPPQVVNRDQVRVPQADAGACFDLEALAGLVARLDQNLDGDVSAGARIPGPVDHAHAPATELFQDLVGPDAPNRHRSASAVMRAS